MPFYDQKAGEFKVLYLQEYDNNGPCYHPFWGISTKDGANYDMIGEVLPVGASTALQDASSVRDALSITSPTSSITSIIRAITCCCPTVR